MSETRKDIIQKIKEYYIELRTIDYNIIEHEVGHKDSFARGIQYGFHGLYKTEHDYRKFSEEYLDRITNTYKGVNVKYKELRFKKMEIEFEIKMLELELRSLECE